MTRNYIQHMTVEVDTDAQEAIAYIDYSNKPSATDAQEILLGFEVGAYWTDETEEMDAVEIQIDGETELYLRAIADGAIGGIMQQAEAEYLDKKDAEAREAALDTDTDATDSDDEYGDYLDYLEEQSELGQPALSRGQWLTSRNK